MDSQDFFSSLIRVSTALKSAIAFNVSEVCLGHEAGAAEEPDPATLRSPDLALGFCGRCGPGNHLRGADEIELLQGGDPIVEADFLKNFSVLEF
jgi:hypothetical protein